MRPRTDGHGGRGERGSVTIWLALASLVMIMLIGLAVDLGGQVRAQQQAHDLAAQAARTGAEQVQASAAIEGTGAIVDAGPGRAAALRYLQAAGVNGTVTLTATTGDQLLTVTVREGYQPRFLGLIGITHLPATGTATAHLIRTLGGNPR